MALKNFFGHTVRSTAEQKVQVYKNNTPLFHLEEFLNGRIDIEGLFQNRAGLVTSRFHVDLDATWSGGKGRLTEDFTFADGQKLNREWSLTRISENVYEGVAPDVIGHATGVGAGNTFLWSYKLRLPYKKRYISVDVEDWMYRINSDMMINRVYFRKFGIKFTEATLVFIKKR